MVSVITITYNRGHLIAETIRSVLTQTYQDFEYIIIDEDSKDETERVVGSFVDPRIRYFKVPNTDGHLSKLRNMGIGKSHGEILAMLDSDDLWDPKKLDLQVGALLNNPEVNISYTNADIFTETGVIRPSLYPNQGPSPLVMSVLPQLVANEIVIYPSTLAFRRKCLATTGMYDQAMHSGAHDFTVRLAADHDAVVLFENLVRIRKHDQNTTKDSPPDRLDEYQHTLGKIYRNGVISKPQFNRACSELLYLRGIEAFQRGVSAPKDFWGSFRLNWRNWKAIIRIPMIFLGFHLIRKSPGK